MELLFTYITLILSVDKFMRSNKLGGLKWCWEFGAHTIQIRRELWNLCSVEMS